MEFGRWESLKEKSGKQERKRKNRTEDLVRGELEEFTMSAMCVGWLLMRQKV